MDMKAAASRGLFILITIIFILVLVLPVPASAAAPTVEWVRRWNGNGNNDDAGKGILVDGSGNVYVAGDLWTVESATDYCTIKYNNTGTLQWVRKYTGSVNHFDYCRGIGIDGAGNVYVTGEVHNKSPYNWDFLTIKYNGAGSAQWIRRQSWPGASSEDQAKAIAVDNAGNVYVTGYSKDGTAKKDYAVVKYNTSGTVEWWRKYAAAAGQDDEPTAIAVDGSGNVYVTGYSYNSSGNQDYATVKWAADGTRKWVKRYDGVDHRDDAATAIAVDGAGNVYITGNSYNQFDNHDCVTIKYNTTNGAVIWSYRYAGPWFSPDYGFDIAVDGSGNAYVAGTIDSDPSVIKYAAANGAILWEIVYHDGYISWDAITLDSSGNAYVTGYDRVERTSGNFDNDYLTARYNSDGVFQWVKRYNGPNTGNDEAKAITVDGSGNVYVTGKSWSTASRFDYATIKYKQN